MYIGKKVLRRRSIRPKPKAKKTLLLAPPQPAVLPLPVDWPGSKVPVTMPLERDRG